ncbi:MAG TPA: TIGR00730 family Rossman fold protein [Acidimicrobiales bacterium]|nr:TIGR00730 family Rossman fold protein [Acidimicrobiales bacterium]
MPPPVRLPRYRTGNADLDEKIVELIDAAGADHDRDQLFEIIATAVRLAGDDADRLDLKITNAALKEMRAAFRRFAPYRAIPKVTMFGSARTHPDDPLYVQARGMAAELAARGWMVVTGAGPGIMAAGMEGAGRDMSFGVTIRLPFENEPNPVIAGDPKLVSMKYFFTRKLMLIKESRAFLCLPGGFGTLDEAFELLTLVQTGKSTPAPIVMLDVPNGTYWAHWKTFVCDELIERGLIAATDVDLFLVTDDVQHACDEIVGFYSNYDSMRYVGSSLVLRLHRAPDAEAIAMLNRDFADISHSEGFEVIAPLPEEIEDDDQLDLARVAFRFNRNHFARLRALIDALNRLP